MGKSNWPPKNFRRRRRSWLRDLMPLIIILVAGAAIHTKTGGPRNPADAASLSMPAYEMMRRAATPPQPTRLPSKKSTQARAYALPPIQGAATISCQNPYVIDGDTIDCSGTRIRLASIDAPEMPDHCRQGRVCTPGDPYASKDYLRSIAHNVVCHPIEKDRYGRTVALCETGGRDLSCAMVRAGHAVERYGALSCSS